MKAILLAAGRGRRLGSDGPKCLLDIDGRSLLERHLHNMKAAGIEAAVIVSGFARDQLHGALDALDAPLPVETVFNELFEHGSLVSLQRAFDSIAHGGIWMDADVLYPAEMLERLVTSTHDNCVLLDGRSSEQGEEMMMAIQGGRVKRIARRVGSDWDMVGESVGFFKVGSDAAQVMKRVLDAEVAAGRLDQEHEAALDIAFGEAAFGHERVDDLPWTEIDFPEDVEKARALNLLARR